MKEPTPRSEELIYQLIVAVEPIEQEGKHLWLIIEGDGGSIDGSSDESTASQNRMLFSPGWVHKAPSASLASGKKT